MRLYNAYKKISKVTMAKNKIQKRTNDLLQVGVIIAILMCFAGYESQHQNPAKDVSSPREYSKSSFPENELKSKQDSIRFTKASL